MLMEGRAETLTNVPLKHTTAHRSASTHPGHTNVHARKVSNQMWPVDYAKIRMSVPRTQICVNQAERVRISPEDSNVPAAEVSYPMKLAQDASIMTNALDSSDASMVARTCTVASSVSVHPASFNIFTGINA